MMQFARVAILSIAGMLCASVTQAQTTTQGGNERMAVEVTGGPTLGHKSSGFVGGEFTWRLMPKLDIFVEGGHMANVGTQALDDNANVIANAVGATVSSSAIKVNHFDAGIKFWIDPIVQKALPYFVFAVGAASTTTEVNFAVNGTVVDPAALGVQLGGDLSGSNTKAIITIGGGIAIPIAARYYVDLGYRFGGILSNTSDIENDTAIKSQRIIFGFGARF
jgi:opacity protein-like surface antigen